MFHITRHILTNFEEFLKDTIFRNIDKERHFHTFVVNFVYDLMLIPTQEEPDLFNNHIIDTDKCSCGSTETADHYLVHCTNYVIQRRETIDTLNVAVNTEILIKGCPMYSDQVNGEIFNKVNKFIIDSKRFS